MGRISSVISILICAAALTGCRTQAQPALSQLPSTGGSASAHHTTAKLVLSADEAKPGDTIWAGVDLKMEPGWHTYWKNPGAAGMPTKIQWQLPPGISAGEIQWPLPEKLPPTEVTTYGYENETMLLVPLTLASNLPNGQLDLKANVSWLECKDICVPANQNVETKLDIGNETKKSADTAAIEIWKNKVPQTNSVYSLSAWWEKSTNADTRSLILQGRQITEQFIPVDHFDFFPNAADNFEVQSATEEISKNSGFRLRKTVKKYSGDWPKEISGVLVTKFQGQRQGTRVNFSIADKAPTAEIISSTSNTPPAPPSQPLWKMLAFAFLGGLILNIMPCVLPVIALKILGFVSEARSEPRRVRNLGLIYALGVLISFLALAGIAIGVKAAGHRAGWGMQFGNPIFLVCLTILVTLVTLNLFGVFEVTLGSRTINSASELAPRHGAPGAFFNGMLATALATPCTAPVLATALGFAFLQDNPVIIVLIFLFVGLGLAAPYVLLSCNPKLLKFLPKPGVWMENFKIVMGFPMLMTVFWLISIAFKTYGERTLWLEIFLVVLAAAAWIFGKFFQHGRNHRNLALGIVLILILGDYGFALEDQLQWRTPMTVDADTVASENIPGGIQWQPWSPDAVAKARAAGHPVLVDFTADWCLTCQVNKKIAIEIPSVRAKLKDTNTIALVADYTHTPDNISAELQKFNRAGVPLVLVYPKNPDESPIVLPQILTPKIVLEALDRAAK